MCRLPSYILLLHLLLEPVSDSFFLVDAIVLEPVSDSFFRVQRLADREFADELVILAVTLESRIRIVCIFSGFVCSVQSKSCPEDYR